MTRCCFFLLVLANHLFAQPLLVRQADSLLGEGEWGAARKVLATGLQQHTRPDTTRAWLLHRLGGVLYYDYDYDAAAEKLDEAWALRASLLPEGHPQLAQTAYMQGVLAWVQSRFSTAEQKLLQAIRIWEASQPLPEADLADAYQLLGKLYSQVGDFGRAEVFFEKALTFCEQLYGPGMEAAEVHLLRSSLCDRQGKPFEALGELRSALSIFNRTSDPQYEPWHAHCWQNMGLAYSNLGNYDSALAYLEAAGLRYAHLPGVAEDNEIRKAQFDNWDNLGIVLRKMGKLDEARFYGQLALDSLSDFYSGPHPDLAPTYDNLGDLALAQGDGKLALKNYNEGLGCLRIREGQWGDPALAARMWLGKARAFPEEESDSVLQAVLVADTLLRYLREAYLEDSSRLMLTQDYLELYELGVQAAVETGDAAAAFYCMGAGRATLLRRVVSRSQAAVALGIPDSLRREVRLLQAELALSSVEDRVTLLSRLRELGRYLDRRYPAFASLREPDLPSLQEFQQHLTSAEAALICFWGERRVYFMEVNHRAVRLYDVRRRDIEAILQPLLTAQEDPGSSLAGLRAQGLAFFDACLPLKQISKDCRRLLLLPDGPLAQLSWAGLPHPEGGWVGEKLAIRVAPAVDLGFESGRKEGQTTGVYAMAPFYPAEGPWPDLPMARTTALAAVQLLGGRADTGAQATLSHFHAYAPQAEILHIGAHGLLNDHNPLEGGIAFSDSMLQVADVYALELPARLAVLTSCHSGGGPQQRGEGILSLARAFSHAGCQSLLSSLWEASADATAEISVHFYRQLKAGLPQDLALQQARIEYLKKAPPERRHPYYWAGLTLTGAAGGRETHGYGWWLLGGILLSGFVAGMVIRRNNKG